MFVSHRESSNYDTELYDDHLNISIQQQVQYVNSQDVYSWVCVYSIVNPNRTLCNKVTLVFSFFHKV